VRAAVGLTASSTDENPGSERCSGRGSADEASLSISPLANLSARILSADAVDASDEDDGLELV